MQRHSLRYVMLCYVKSRLTYHNTVYVLNMGYLRVEVC